MKCRHKSTTILFRQAPAFPSIFVKNQFKIKRKNMKKIILFTTSFIMFFSLKAQKDTVVHKKDSLADLPQNMKVTKQEIKKAEEQGMPIEYEKAFNVFAGAGFSHRLSDLYSVTISPIDRTVQFDLSSPANFSLTTGFIWNPFIYPYKKFFYKDKTVDWKYEYLRWPLAIALLINVYNINLGSTKANYGSAIDGGFGIGYRKDNFCILATYELSYLKQPRDYFISQYKDKNKNLLLYNSNQPTQSISIEDNSIFDSKFFPSLGIRIAYAFGKQKE